jgi:anthranilate synthase component I
VGAQVHELSYEQFRDSARGGGTIPVWRDALLDALTPVEAFARLRRGPFDFLLESTAVGSDVWARYTFIGSDARRAWRLRRGVVEDWSPERGWFGARQPEDPLEDLGRLLAVGYWPLPHSPAKPEPTPFWAGAVGYFGYDVVRHLERLPSLAQDDTTIPDAMFVVPAAVITLDKFKAQARVVSGVEVDARASEADLRTAWESGRAEVDRVVERLKGDRIMLPPIELSDSDVPAEGLSSRSREEFIADVERAKEYIRAGDAFQIVLSRRIELERDFDSAVLYRTLRAINPSPYMYHLAFDGVELVGCSPELLVRVADNRVTVRPIAGTRPRPANPEADDRMAEELSSDPKERAEHLMLVDLGRNDVGRVARYGTVNVDKLLAVERYSHVLHLVSDVSGELAEGKTAIDALEATFPAGTMSGAPKVRAMEIIDELEPVRRGPYAGSLGFIGAGGRHMDLAVTIRTCVIEGNRAFVQAGAGIVADSVPEKEWEETEKKAQAVLVAIAHARRHSQNAGAR